MTMKTKRTLAVGGGSVFCAALVVLIATRFAPEPEVTAPDTSNTSSTAHVNVQISTPKPSVSKPTEKAPENNSAINLDNIIPETNDPEKEAADFIEGGGIEIRQDFPEPEKKNESAPRVDNTQNTPPAPPEINDEKMLTDPTKEPAYKPEQVQPQQTEPNRTPKHGDKKDGMIYINGFGWVKDEGGGGEGEYLENMYENGNKIGYFG